MTERTALLPSLRDNPLFLMQRAALALTARSRKLLKAQGIDDVNLAQLGILAALEAEDGLTATALSRAVRYEKSTLTPLLDKLEGAGLILRARDPKDGRAQRLFVTKKGRKRRREAEAVLASLTALVLDALPKKALKHHMTFCEAVLSMEEDAVTVGEADAQSLRSKPLAEHDE